MVIYRDKEFKCYVAPAEGLTPVEESFFDGKCTSFIEGHRLVLAGENWTREDGKVFSGKMISPWKDSKELDAAQAQYERDMEDLQRAYQEGVDSV